MQGLSPDQIQALMGKAKTRGVYGKCLSEFVASDEAGINPREVWPEHFSEKSASAIMQSFTNAVNKAKLENEVLVRKDGEDVYLIHVTKLAALTAEAELQAA